MSSLPSNQILPFTSSSRQNLLVYLEQLAQLESVLFDELQKYDEQTILDIRFQATQIEKYRWRIECACDAAIWNHVEQAKRGRGNKDVDAVGVLAAVSKKAKLIGVTPRTIFKNAQVYRLMQEVKNSCFENSILEILDEKGFYIVALSAADPIKALIAFTEKKLTEKRFRVTDASRLLRAEGQTRQAVALKAVEQIRTDTGQLSFRQELLAHIIAAKKVIEEQIIPTCPDVEFKERIWQELLLTLNEESQELFDQDAREAVIKAWDEGAHREDEMAAKTGLPLPDVSRLMETLEGDFIAVQPRDIKERSNFILWHKAGEPFDNARFMPKGRGC